MIELPMRSAVPLTRQTLSSLNNRYLPPHSAQTISTMNRTMGMIAAAVYAEQMQRQNTPPVYTQQMQQQSTPPVRHNQILSQNGQTLYQNQIQGAYSSQSHPQSTSAAAPQIDTRQLPGFVHPVLKGQRVSLADAASLHRIRVNLGWNVLNAACDVDVSAFLLNSAGKVIGDDWFVFYGQTNSPDNSTIFSEAPAPDREAITIDLDRLNPAVAKIVFVLTINEALEKRLNFSMLKDAYIRIMDAQSSSELVSFLMSDYYANVTSMMIGELYLNKGVWKFNAIGNGVARDLAGLCELYGVQVI
ncbi:MAG: TerD family protein [Eubacteriales bacterium]|nr:TerD family protein [Eubacteriales bacterium]